MIIGIDEIKVYQSWSDEWGVYRVYKEQGNLRRFLMFPCSTRQEACYYAERIAKLLRKRYPGEHFESLPKPPSSDKPESGSSSEEISEQTRAEQPDDPAKKPSRRKKVMGVGKLIRQCILEGLTDDQIVDALLPKYLETGRDEKDARWTIRVSIDNVRKEIAS
jgi:hypothetical protein